MTKRIEDKRCEVLTDNGVYRIMVDRYTEADGLDTWDSDWDYQGGYEIEWSFIDNIDVPDDEIANIEAELLEMIRKEW